MIGGGLLNILPDNFNNILPDNYNLFFYRNDDQYAIYISEFETELNNIQNIAIGYVTFVIDYDDSELTIQFIESKMPRVGIGHYLMLIIGYLAHTQRIEKILLDDDSDLAHKGSIYHKVGCKYISEEPYPEMECNPLDILNKYDEFYKKYKNKGFFV
jgi:hypothetical protein